MHHGTAPKRRAMTTMLALVLLFAFKPDNIVTAAVLACYALPVPHFLKSLAASCFIRKILVELKNLHISTILQMLHKGNHFDYNIQIFTKLFLLECKKNRRIWNDVPIFGGTIADNHIIKSSTT